ncbi:MAG: hypothetical protein LBV14_05405 [Acidovorax sp.]|jgi:hypothetical protein|nr:hypothetical protein [Acidovorax sp.]
MKETGLMFKAPLVRAVLSGQKTQTRRSVKPQPAPNHPHDGGTVWVPKDGLHIPVGSVGHLSVKEKMGISCPMGQLGDRIYVRETFAPYERDCFYRADSGSAAMDPWKPAIHMPKALARIWLEVTGVRVERLQQITEADCIAEGALGGHGAIPGYQYSATPLEHFRHIWESTGGDWAANPWVWIIDFRVLSITGRPQ